jgi:choline dehydrogenase-like flavoprotein
MIIDARALPDDTALKATLCIIGGGMAAIAIARELRGSGIDVLILEAGGEKPTAEGQTLFRGRGTMHDADGRTRDISGYLPSSRIRAFGGSGHVWGGKCGRLDPSDFEARDWVPDSGWPFNRAALDPYYDRASKHLELPSFTHDLISGDPARPPLRVGDGKTWETVPRFHSPVSGAQSNGKFDAFRYSVTSVPNIRVCVNAPVTQIRLTPDGRAVSGLGIRTLEGKRLTASADQYILASGAIENARLLLHSNATMKKAVGNDNGLVGGYFGGHLNVSTGDGEKTSSTGIAFGSLDQPFDLYVDNDILKVWGIWNATQRAQRAYRMHNTWVAFGRENTPPTPSEMAMERLARATKGTVPIGKPEYIGIRVMAEQPPTPSSRVGLDSAIDELGVQKVTLDWRLSDSYLRGFQRSIDILGREVGASRLGRVHWPVQRSQMINLVVPARHHIGTTRMNANPKKGIVDEHCRVHGIGNLSIAGSSVFPTAGIVNPTLTLIALAVRLADRVRTSLGRAA